MEKWINIDEQKPDYGEVVEVVHALTGVGAPERPGFAYTGRARYRFIPAARPPKKITPMSYWAFEVVKHEPGYNILDNGGLAPTHWRRIDGI